MDAIIVDTTDLASLSADLGALTGTTLVETRKVLERGAGNIVRTLRSDVDTYSAGGHLARVRYALGFAETPDGDGLSLDIGAKIGDWGKRTQGPLAWIGFEGTATSGPVWPDPSIALEAEAPAIEAYLAQILDDL